MSQVTTTEEYLMQVRRIGARHWKDARRVGSKQEGALLLLVRERQRLQEGGAGVDYELRLMHRTVVKTTSSWRRVEEES